VNKHQGLHEKIRTLRRNGLTYSEINAKLGTRIPKSSLSYICRGIILTADQTIRINSLLGELLTINRQKALAANKGIQISLREKIRRRNLQFKHLSEREAKIALALLYLGEGAKWRSHRGLYLGSSDPRIISIYMGLLKRCYGIQAGEFKCRISHRADQNLGELEEFWSKQTKIPRSNFYKTKPDPRTVGKPTLRPDYRGVCVLMRRGTEIQLELQSIADIISENMGM